MIDFLSLDIQIKGYWSSISTLPIGSVMSKNLRSWNWTSISYFAPAKQKIPGCTGPVMTGCNSTRDCNPDTVMTGLTHQGFSPRNLLRPTQTR